MRKDEAMTDEEIEKIAFSIARYLQDTYGLEIEGSPYLQEAFLSAFLKVRDQSKLEADKTYQPFLDWLFEEVFEGSPDGGDIQDKAEEFGLLVLCKIPENEKENYNACMDYDTDEIYFPIWSKEAKKWAIKIK